MSFIYIITNNVNDKVYIGKTDRTIEARWKEHQAARKENSKKHYKLYAAMNKYGFENFSIGKIEECAVEKVNEREKYWIKRFDSYNNGYNMTLGGDGTSSVNEQKILELWDSGLAIADISRETGYATKTILQRLTLYENYSQEESLSRGKTLSSEAKYKNIYLYNSDGNGIEKYKNAQELSEQKQIKVEKIREWCRNNSIREGLLYSYELLSPQQVIDIFLHQPNQKGVRQYNLQGVLVGTYKSINEAMRQTGINNISQAAKDNIKTAGGYIWRYIDDNQETYFPKNTQNKKRVAQYSKSGQLIQIYDSITQAAKATGQKSSSNISQVCKGKAATAGGFIWRYYEESYN